MIQIWESIDEYLRHSVVDYIAFSEAGIAIEVAKNNFGVELGSKLTQQFYSIKIYIYYFEDESK